MKVDVSLDLYRIFCAVVRTGNMSAAARAFYFAACGKHVHSPAGGPHGQSASGAYGEGGLSHRGGQAVIYLSGAGVGTDSGGGGKILSDGTHGDGRA